MGGMDVKGQGQGLGLVGWTPLGELGERLVPSCLLEGLPSAKSGASSPFQQIRRVGPCVEGASAARARARARGEAGILRGRDAGPGGLAADWQNGRCMGWHAGGQVGSSVRG